MGALKELELAAAAALALLADVDWSSVAVAVIGMVFLWSGLEKVRRPIAGALGLVGLGLVSRVDAALGRGAGFAEVALASGLLLAPDVRPFTASATVLCSFFTLQLGRRLFRGDNAPCYCFGPSVAPLDGWAVIRPMLLALVAMLVTFVQPSPADVLGHLVAIGVAVSVIGTCVLSFELPSLVALLDHRHAIERVQ